VLNQSGVSGEAARVAAELENLGYSVTGVGNWRGNVPATTVYYPPGEEAAAAQVAADLGVSRTRERVDPMRTDALTVIITAALDL
jgi:hypothetical protein